MTDMITEVPGFQESQPPVAPPTAMIEAVPADMKASIDATAAAEQAKREEQQAATESVATDISAGAEAVGLPPTTPYAEAPGDTQEVVEQAVEVSKNLVHGEPSEPDVLVTDQHQFEVGRGSQPLPVQPEAPPVESTNNQ